MILLGDSGRVRLYRGPERHSVSFECRAFRFLAFFLKLAISDQWDQWIGSFVGRRNIRPHSTED